MSLIGNDFYKSVKSDMERIAETLNVEIGDLTIRDMENEGYTEWDFRKRGGFKAVKSYILHEGIEIKQTSDRRIVISDNGVSKSLTTPQVESFQVNEIDLKQAFKRAKLKNDEVFKVIVLPDLHIPEHDERALASVIKFMKDYKPHSVVFLGDTLEMNGVSHWDPRDTAPKRIVPEIKIARKIIDEVIEAAGENCVEKVFLIGNHEFWLNDYIAKKAPEFLDGIGDLGVDLSIEGLLKLKENNFKIVPLNEILKIGASHYIHGWYTGTHHAKKTLDAIGSSVYYGHVHDVQSHSSTTVKGLKEAMSLGCLRTLNAPFLKGKPNNWVHSFGVFDIFLDGSYTRYAPIIINGQFSFNGKVYK